MKIKTRRDIPWEKIGDDDYKAIIDGYMLRAEDMGDWWWWCVYLDTETIADCYRSHYKENATHERVAKYRAYIAFKRHYKKSNAKVTNHKAAHK